MDPGGGVDADKSNRPPPRFNLGVSLLDAIPAQLDFVHRELARFVQAGA
jgi:hypothetical protein